MQRSTITERIPCPHGKLSRHALRLFAYLMLCSPLAATIMPAVAQDNQTEARSHYQTERANCLNGRSSEDLETCLKEAHAALAEEKRGRLDDSGVQYQKNAALRCQALDSDSRQACERRMRGEGTVSGSVAAGGILRELVTREPEQHGAPTPVNGVNTSAPDSARPADGIK
jgi:hypothetical protein